jgi:signal transduction histidine kinase
MASHGLFALTKPPEGRRSEGLSVAEATRKYEEEERRRSFLRMVSHELRTPLNSIIGFSEIIASELYGPMEDPRYRNHAEIVRESGLKLLRLVNQVMEIARLEAGTADLDIHPELLVPALEEAASPFLYDAEARGIDIRIEGEPDLPPVMADSRALRTVVTNLLQNAMAFSPDGGVITISLARNTTSIWIRIRDQGPGVEPSQLTRLMRPFEQGEAALTRRSEGAGLGLPIVRLLCRAMKGALRLESAPGDGFTAIVRLPFASPDDLAKADHAA